MTHPIPSLDPEVAAAIDGEIRRQQETLELIASENFVSPAVLAAAGTVFTNKYAEGYPGRRYYGGCEFVDIVERLARDRACALFGAEHANVQPHSGSQANMAVYFTACKPGDTVLGMNLSHGGHLTHGHPLNFSGMMYRIIPYGVRRDTETIDYDEMEALAREHRPRLIVVGASAYSRVIDFERIRAIADAAGAMVMTDMAHIAGLVAAGLHPSPVASSEFVTTTTHKTLRGPRGGVVLCRKTHAKDLERRSRVRLTLAIYPLLMTASFSSTHVDDPTMAELESDRKNDSSAGAPEFAMCLRTSATTIVSNSGPTDWFIGSDFALSLASTG